MKQPVGWIHHMGLLQFCVSLNAVHLNQWLATLRIECAEHFALLICTKSVANDSPHIDCRTDLLSLALRQTARSKNHPTHIIQCSQCAIRHHVTLLEFILS